MYDDLDDLDDLVTALHDVVLPANLPVLPWLDVAAHFAVAAEPGEATGAWFDVVVLRSGRVGFVVGQVPGSGVEAVAAAAAVGAVLRSGLLCHEDVVAALELADLHAQSSPDARGTTVTLVVVDRDLEELTYVTAGHEAPILAAASGPSRRLDRTGHRPLGWTGTDDAGRHSFGDGSVVVLSSALDQPEDGEVPRALTTVLDRTKPDSGAAGRCEAVAAHLAQTLTRGAAIALVASAHEAVGAELALDYSLDADTVRSARLALQQWLDTLGATPVDASFVTHAVAELVTNVREHAYESDMRRGTVGVRATHLASGEVVVEVSDHGTWRTASEDVDGGRGLAMAAGLVDSLDVVRTAEGTHARIRHRLVRPVVVDRTSTTRRPGDEPVTVSSAGPGVVRLVGVLGHDEVEQIASALLIASRGGTRELTVDLTDLTAVSAVGLRLLADLVSTDHDDDPVIVLHARSGSDPQRQLERAGIGHRVA